MKLSELVKGIAEVKLLGPGTRAASPESVEVLGLVADSRQVETGFGFVARRGGKVNGLDFLDQVLSKGCSVVFVEKGLTVSRPLPVPVYEFSSDSRSLGLMASRLYKDPTHRMTTFGVTGTNGKTSITYFLEHLLNRAGFPCGVIGTIDHHLAVGDDVRVWESHHTTPDVFQLQRRLAEMKSLGAQAVAMEVSSHGLHQRRVDGVAFNTVIFTNLTRDHLDYHTSMQDYFEQKQKLFTDHLWDSGKIPLFAIVNEDDSWGRRLRVCSEAGLWTFGSRETADFSFEILEQTFAGTKFLLRAGGREIEVELPMVGEHNVSNAVAALAALATIEVPLDKTIPWLREFRGVPGRLERVRGDDERFVFVDYAHTPDGLESVLGALRRLRDSLPSKPRIHVVFGCGGDRDRGKRPLMAAIAEKGADRVIVTSDNPRSENPESILNEIRQGFQKPEAVEFEVDRKIAIRKALSEVREGEVCLIAGKGHEKTQTLGSQILPFSDVAVAQEILMEGVR